MSICRSDPLIAMFLKISVLSSVFVSLCISAGADVKFTDVADVSGIEFQHFTGATGARYMPETMGAGCAFLDYDTDGNLDILLANGTSLTRPNAAHTPRLYRNTGDGQFVDVTEAAGLDVSMYGMGITAADYDNDADLDIYFTNVGENRLFRNNGDRTFTDVTESAKVGDSNWSTSATFFDADKDGWLDLFVCNYVEWTPETDIPCIVNLPGEMQQYRTYCTPSVYTGQSCRFYRNQGDGTFSDRTLQAGLYNPTGKSLGVTLLDYNHDGWIDLAVANDTGPNFLYRNNGDGTFTDEAVVMGIAFSETGKARGSMGIDAADLYNDGGTVIAIGNFSNEKIGFFYTKPGSIYFTDVAERANIGRISHRLLTFGLLFFDCDLDGALDLFCVNGHIEPEVLRYQQHIPYAQLPSLFQHQSDGTFRDITERAGLAQASVGRGCAYGDYDNDGDLDLLVSNNGVSEDHGKVWLLRNDSKRSFNYLRVRVIGTHSNRDGIGTSVRVSVDGSVQEQMVRTGSSYCSQSEMVVTFGLGSSEVVEHLEVLWLSGKIDRYEKLKANQLIEVIEGASEK
ncbi:MAG: CRTAC1 family protein [Candidatus Poribacteria bacterium]|nr:CRTAC1 family protein [Candidatus Poribacteria bacterium]